MPCIFKKNLSYLFNLIALIFDLSLYFFSLILFKIPRMTNNTSRGSQVRMKVEQLSTQLQIGGRYWQ